MRPLEQKKLVNIFPLGADVLRNLFPTNEVLHGCNQ